MQPNIVYILADDLGYGDVGCYGASKVKTPHMDKLAQEGVRFTDAHSPSAVCTPTRYSILTGRYCWRGELKKGVLKGFSPPLIEPGRLTVASMLKRLGYSTACIGKWHLGLGWQEDENGNVDFTRPLTSSPNDYGFDYFFGISGSLNMEPYCFIENNHTVGIPSVRKDPVRRGQNPDGLMVPEWRDEHVNEAVTMQAIDFMQCQVERASDKPFFLYLPLTGPHNPWVPNDRFLNSSEVGLRGDMIQEFDWSVGQVMAQLDELGISDNTLVIVTSDNGPHSFDTDEKITFGHDQTGGYRGQKSDIWDGGHRVPFLAKWPNHIPMGITNNELIELTDFIATCAELAGVQLQVGEAEDSVSILSLLNGKKDPVPVRDYVVHHSIHGMFAIRNRKWKYIEGQHSGGFLWKKQLESEPDVPLGQLYDMESDCCETTNLYDSRRDIVESMTRTLDEVRARDVQ